ncbi:MAG: hypothetical protein GXX96_28715 [Planctomycetaceae bacterium]|nr:hypothetical protein [Planctomycetaceae bacterium]
MRFPVNRLVAVAVVVALTWIGRAQAASPVEPSAVVASPCDSLAERLAAKEIRRYIYLRTGKLLPIVEQLDKAPAGAIVVGRKDRPAVQAVLTEPAWRTTVDALAPEQYVVRTLQQADRPLVLIAGGDSVGTLYGAYRVAEHLGVRFYLHGDELPDRQIPLAIAPVNETGTPLFDRRGIQPFHDFPEGPDWWNEDGYKAILGQLAKLRMNFFGLHTYPEGRLGPEPLTWIGLTSDIRPDGRVAFSYPSRHFTTKNGTWGYGSTKTSDYLFGAGGLFDRDDYGVDYMRGMTPWPETLEDSNELFDRMGQVLRSAFGLAGQLGIKTCLGTETPITLPTPVKERLQAAGKDPADPAVVQEVYEGMFRRIMATHPLDYYWLWTPEGWTWKAVNDQQVKATLADLRAAIAAAEKVRAPFTLATCGWVLGPPQEPSLFDKVLPKSMPMSCINRKVGYSPVEPGFAEVHGRPTWAIPWMEDDGAMNSPQLWVGRIRKDAADARAYGCTGLMGIHWRTRGLGPNVSALAKAAWDQHDWNPALNPELQTAEPTPAEGPEGGQCAAFLNNVIADTEEKQIYQSVRYDVRAYNFDLPNGTYKVTLKFCEPLYKEPGKRIFGAKLQGKTVLDRLDLFAKAGRNRAIDYAFENVQVSDGGLAIDFIYQTDNPCIAGIVIQGPATHKINCGGPAWQDYQADWPAATAPGQPRDRHLPTADFYADWTRIEFGDEVADEAAAVFTKIDSHLPRPTSWVDGPGGIKPDPRAWTDVAKEYTFVDKLARLEPRVRGAACRERFLYWLNTFRYQRANGQVNCTWARFNGAMAKVKAEKDSAIQKRLARELALPIRKELISQVSEMHKWLLATVSTTGEMGNVANWQQHCFPKLVTLSGEELAAILDEQLPADAMPSTDDSDEPRLVVPFVRTSLMRGERLSLTVIVLGPAPTEASLFWRPLGTGPFAEIPLEHVARGVHQVTLPVEATQADFEYFIAATAANGPSLHFPAAAPAQNQSVVVVEP